MSFFAVDNDRYLNIDHIESLSKGGPLPAGENSGMWFLQIKTTSNRVVNTYYATCGDRDDAAETLLATAAGMT